MKATGIIRRVDDLGRVVIPKEIRRNFGIREGDPLEIFVDNGYICLRKYQPETFTKILDDFKELKDYAFEYGGSAQEQRVENLRLLVEKELNEIFEE